MKRLLLCYMLLCSLPYLNASECPLVIESGMADYNGKKMVLSQNVIIEHFLGKIAANYMEVIPERVDNKMRINHLMMRNNVRIALKDGGELACSQADIDYDLLKGEFNGDIDQKYVVYTESLKNEGSAPLTVASQHMIVQLSPQTNSPSFQNRIALIEADNDVTISYNNDFIAKGDIASYKRVEGEEARTKNMPGIVSLRINSEGGVCHVSSKQGDQIEASEIAIDTNKHHVLLFHPQGAINVSNSQLAQKIDFSSDTMIWDDIQHALTLRGHVNISQPGMGALVNDDQLLILQDTINGEKQIRTIESNGETRLTYIDQEQGVEHVLVCYGKLVVDHQQCKTTMESPRDLKGKVLADKQVFFQDPLGEIYADKLTILYEVIDRTLTPSQLILEGHVRIVKSSEIGVPDTTGFSQYALADRVEYAPQAKEISLSATKPRRVLFFDRINQLQVSALALKIRRDEITNKETVRGIGDVRFSFVRQEMEQLQKIFPGLVH